ncbi:beta-1,3-glucan-binding protein 1-like [Macrosteles quadrilineatus]|uniref:beta-1,3-glucan-binding protein 1-like n=1 Tax=Macrosteles quadrilineatus TaxID=74068 RepID=UPI0023E1824F|nr:beta-1,3-glucan-binding protein 1-like [Macrosteles quadrilineatus]
MPYWRYNPGLYKEAGVRSLTSYRTDVTPPAVRDAVLEIQPRLVQGGWCTIPDQLQNGRYSPSSKRCRTGDTTPACQMIPGAYVPPNWVIYFSCNPGYKLNTTKLVAACFNGNWIPWLAQCEKESSLEPCAKSDTIVNSGNNRLDSCSGDVVFEDSFNGQLSDMWRHSVLIGDTPDDMFNVFRDDPQNGFTSEGNLVIKPTVFNAGYVTSGLLHLQGCTAPEGLEMWLCNRTGFPFSILPPVASARIQTRDSFSFRYGVVEIRAKLPRGDWLVPELWLEPKDHVYGPGLSSGRIRIALVRGNSELQCKDGDLGLQRLESGVLLGPEDKVRRRSIRTTLPDSWHDEFHNYSLIWKPGSISFKVDNENERELALDGGHLCGADAADANCSIWSNGSTIAPFDKDFYISLGLSAGSERDFADDCVNRGQPKPWRNLDFKAKSDFWDDRDNWRLTWSEAGSALYIDHIRVTAL